MLGTASSTLGRWRLGVVTSTGAPVALAGSCTVLTAAIGGLGVDLALAGQANTSTTASGNAGKDQGGAGQADVTSTAAGTLTADLALGGQADVTTALHGAVTMPVHIALGGTVAGVVFVVGTLARNHRRVVMAEAADEVTRIKVTDEPAGRIVVRDRPLRITVTSTGRPW